ncbi:MAG: hypothetical protein JW940_28230 [Polyangiaceae bacterium]|nr:hypothetical protein [Polyangiaceae bacterium]
MVNPTPHHTLGYARHTRSHGGAAVKRCGPLKHRSALCWAFVASALACQPTEGRPGSASAAAQTGFDAGGAANDSSDLGAAGQSETGSQPSSACRENRAFVAVFTAFVDPTPVDVALGLNSATFGTNPIALVLSGARAEPSLAVSYPTTKDGVQAFPKACSPSPAPAWIKDNRFGTSSAQVEGWMLVKAAAGPLEVPLRNISVAATTEPDCTHGMAMLTAVIPTASVDSLPRLSTLSQADDAAEETQADDGGCKNHKCAAQEDARDAPADVTIRAMFALELVDFDTGAFE